MILYVCHSCPYATNSRVRIKDHAAMRGHMGWGVEAGGDE